MGQRRRTILNKRLVFTVFPLPLLMIPIAFYGCTSKPKTIETVRVKRGDIIDFIEATGRVEAVEEAVIRAKTEARIEKVLVDEGEQVKGGDQLILFDLTERGDAVKRATIKLEQARIALREAKIKREASEQTYADPSELQSNLEAKEDSYQQALIVRDSAEREYEIFRELYHIEAKSLLDLKDREDHLKEANIKLQKARRELEEAKDFFTRQEKSKINLAGLRAEYENALKQKALAETELDLAVRQLDRLEVSSPIAGTVVSREVKDGMVVSVGQPIMTIADTGRLQVRAEVDELDAGRIHKGQEAEITFDAFPDKKFTGQVTRIAPQALIEEERTIVETVIRIDEHMGLLKIANQVDVKIIIEKKLDVLSLPLGAVHKGSPPFIWRYQKGIARKGELKTGLSDMDSIEIIDGLQEGDEVIVSQHAQLQDGERVRIKQ